MENSQKTPKHRLLSKIEEINKQIVRKNQLKDELLKKIEVIVRNRAINSDNDKELRKLIRYVFNLSRAIEVSEETEEYHYEQIYHYIRLYEKKSI